MGRSFDQLIARVKSEVRGISPEEGQQRLQNGKGGLLLDVREREDYAEGYIPRAMNLPRGFLDLRIEALKALSELPLHYYALGSLVPFLNRNHDIAFVGKNILAARQLLPATAVIHLYGAGDPLELPFFMALGCDVFDSSSYLHYARGGWYMTPYGAIQSPGDLEKSGFLCPCPVCREDRGRVPEDRRQLARHNLFTIYSAMETALSISAEGTLSDYLLEIIKRHQSLFPDSHLEKSWNELVTTGETGGMP
jgi:7-cyano-7-deazaguanine tRNA-ribosyltransferase